MSKSTLTKQFVNRTEAAEIIGVTRQTLYFWAKRGILIPKMGNTRLCLYHLDDIRNFRNFKHKKTEAVKSPG